MTDNWDPEIAKYFLVQNEWDVTVSYKQNAVRQFLEQSQDT